MVCHGRKSARAFTLIELMIVIAIIAILAAILIPNFLHARAESQTAGCEANEKNIATALEMYAVDNDGTYVGGTVTSTLLGVPYLDITPVDPVSGAHYSVNAASGTYGKYEISDGGGHDPTTTGNLPGTAGGTSIVFDQNAGLFTK